MRFTEEGRRLIKQRLADNGLQGTGLRIIQALLGHNSSRTTEIYTHVAVKNLVNIKNPIDDIFQ